MQYRLKFFEAIGIEETERKRQKDLSDSTGIPIEYLKYLQKKDKLPSLTELKLICTYLGISFPLTKLKLGILDQDIITCISRNAESFSELAASESIAPKFEGTLELKFKTEFGKLYQGDCMELLHEVESGTVDMVFADPPFNLNKEYASNMNDALKESEYLEWTYRWLDECIRVLKYGGTLLVYNLPKWNIYIGNYLSHRLNFRHWVAIDLKYSLPIQGRLYPAHYSMLYYVKGDKPNTFNPDRMPMEVCPKCFGDLKDYGGYKDRMNPAGVNLTDIWRDIPPVRHNKYKKRKEANELSIKLLDRVIEMSTKKGDLIFDPFGGSGTTYAVAEIKKRRWLGIELGLVDGIIERLQNKTIEAEFIEKHRNNYNALFPLKTHKERERRGLWTCESVKKNNDPQMKLFQNHGTDFEGNKKGSNLNLNVCSDMLPK